MKSTETAIIEQADMDQTVAALSKLYGFEPGSPQSDAIAAGQTAVWQSMAAMDADEDGRISLDEYVQANVALMANPEQFQALQIASSEQLLGLIDLDGDGKLSESEIVKALGAFNIDEDGARQAYQKMDRDHDGFIRTEELLKNVEEFYMSEDPDAPGNWLVGPY